MKIPFISNFFNRHSDEEVQSLNRQIEDLTIRAENAENELTQREIELVALRKAIMPQSVRERAIEAIDIDDSKLKIMPSKRGQIGEAFVERILCKYFENVKNTSKIKESGDFIVDDRILIEVKNYSKVVPTVEVDKFQRDMQRQKLRVGVFISLNSKIAKISSGELHLADDRAEYYIVSCDPKEIKQAVRFAYNIRCFE